MKTIIKFAIISLAFVPFVAFAKQVTPPAIALPVNPCAEVVDLPCGMPPVMPIPPVGVPVTSAGPDSPVTTVSTVYARINAPSTSMGGGYADACFYLTYLKVKCTYNSSVSTLFKTDRVFRQDVINKWVKAMFK